MQERDGRAAGRQGTEALDHALGVMDRAARDLATALAGVMANHGDGAGRARRAVIELQMALGVVLEERVRVDRLRNEVAGVVGGRALDLDAARVEIGRRLARLRDAGNGE
ncbi:hypothetical protein [Fuscovulum ytuae]|uniref:Uncharacterized protein n=1 Tax=Fuscovulum ytuae TaxID=3042299 RepID=A0ABY8Q9X1_9RHOB|nr:hypothetical protein [Fuscovulum sp. YMD61]WGV17080.1 hypothetical protein QF092_04550 [Fuscovulum sp. YMD61]